MGALGETIPSAVLRNKGLPVKVYRVEQTDDGVWTRTLNSADEPVLEDRFVRLSNMSLADIEDKFGTLEEWEQALRRRPFITMVDTLAIAWSVPREQAGAMLIDGEADDYSAAIGGAFLLANGTDPDAVVDVMRAGVRAVRVVNREVSKKLTEEAEKSEAELDKAFASTNPSPGPSGTQPGSAPDSPTTDSGT